MPSAGAFAIVARTSALEMSVADVGGAAVERPSDWIARIETISAAAGFVIRASPVNLTINGVDEPGMALEGVALTEERSDTMAEFLLRYQAPITGPDGLKYEARAYGAAIDDDRLWEGWVEFVPIDGGSTIRTPRETTQPNRVNTVYWASGLEPVYLEGALLRALAASR